MMNKEWLKDNYSQLQHNYLNYRKDNGWNSNDKEYILDYNLEKLLKDRGLKQSTINNVCVYWTAVDMFLRRDGKRIKSGTIHHSSIETLLGLSYEEDRRCHKELTAVGYLSVFNNIVTDPITKEKRTDRVMRRGVTPINTYETVDAKRCWVQGIQKFGLTIDEAVIMSALMYKIRLNTELAEYTGLSRPTVNKILKHLRELGLLVDNTNMVDYEKCGIDLSNEFDEERSYI